VYHWTELERALHAGTLVSGIFVAGIYVLKKNPVGGMCVRLTLVENLTIALKSLEQYGYQRVRLVELSSDVRVVEIRHTAARRWFAVPRCSVPFRYLNF